MVFVCVVGCLWRCRRKRRRDKDTLRQGLRREDVSQVQNGGAVGNPIVDVRPLSVEERAELEEFRRARAAELQGQRREPLAPPSELSGVERMELEAKK